MKFGFFQHRPRRTAQEGYILLVLMLMAALVTIGLTVELPAIRTQIRRDRENELIHRGAQYARAIKRYYKKFGQYPARIEQLENTNNIRFLRKKYKDPITGEDFRLLRFGDVSLSSKNAGATTGPGVAPGSGLAGAPAQGQVVAPPQNQPLGGAQSQPLGGAQTQPFGGAQTQPAGGAQAPGQSPFGSSSSNSVFGGGPIIGVASTSDKKSLHVFNEKDHYKDWEFIYDPTQDRGGLIQGPYNGAQMLGGGNIPGAVAPGLLNPGQANPGQPQPFGQPIGQPFGGQAPGANPQPRTPQQ